MLISLGNFTYDTLNRKWSNLENQNNNMEENQENQSEPASDVPGAPPEEAGQGVGVEGAVAE